MKKSYYYGKHFIDQKDINAVKKCLFSNSISQGNELKRSRGKCCKVLWSKILCSSIKWNSWSSHGSVIT